MARIVRLLIVAFGALQLVGGVALVAAGHGEGLWVLAFGAFLVVVPLVERQRYRSEAAEKSVAPIGPGGGETADTPVEARFRATGEVFVDPTTGHRMQVLADPRTGERRYVADA
jgi:hypothetical protein